MFPEGAHLFVAVAAGYVERGKPLPADVGIGFVLEKEEAYLFVTTASCCREGCDALLVPPVDVPPLLQQRPHRVSGKGKLAFPREQHQILDGRQLSGRWQ